jgi:hypothetical protein
MQLVEKLMGQKRRYVSFLLRMWEESGGDRSCGDEPLWRASLERPQGAEREMFASLADLFAFLEDEARSGSPDLEGQDEVGYQPPAIPDPLLHERGWSHR